jgi:hypothetical protein
MDLNRRCRNLHDKCPYLNRGENDVKSPHTSECKLRKHQGAQTRKLGLRWAKKALGWSTHADWPKTFLRCLDLRFDLVPPRAISSSEEKSHGEIHSSSAATRWMTPPSTTSEDSTPWPALQCVKSLFVLGVEGGSWVVITDPMFWIFLLSYSCWWCVNLNCQLACFGHASLVVSRIMFLLFFMWLPSYSCDNPPRKIPYYHLNQSTLVIKQ